MSLDRPGIAYVGRELEHYEDCMRLVPAIAKAKAEGRVHDVFILMSGMVDDGAERGMDSADAWACFSSAALAWVTQLFAGAAANQQEPATSLIDRAIVACARWAAHVD